MNKNEKWDSFYIALTSWVVGLGSMRIFKSKGINISLFYFLDAIMLLEASLISIVNAVHYIDPLITKYYQNDFKQCSLLLIKLCISISIFITGIMSFISIVFYN